MFHVRRFHKWCTQSTTTPLPFLAPTLSNRQPDTIRLARVPLAEERRTSLARRSLPSLRWGRRTNRAQSVLWNAQPRRRWVVSPVFCSDLRPVAGIVMLCGMDASAISSAIPGVLSGWLCRLVARAAASLRRWGHLAQVVACSPASVRPSVASPLLPARGSPFIWRQSPRSGAGSLPCCPRATGLAQPPAHT